MKRCCRDWEIIVCKIMSLCFMLLYITMQLRRLSLYVIVSLWHYVICHYFTCQTTCHISLCHYVAMLYVTIYHYFTIPYATICSCVTITTWCYYITMLICHHNILLLRDYDPISMIPWLEWEVVRADRNDKRGIPINEFIN